MTTSVTADADRERRFNAVLLAFAQASEKGNAPDRQRFLADHPEFATELEEYFASLDCVQRLSPRPPPERKPSRSSLDMGPLGDFRLVREVGRGGMGIVYEARQVSLGRVVALKVLPFAAALDPRQLQRFKNEAHAAALLHHPNIVPIYSVGFERNIHFYAMQFIEGHSLADMIRGLRRASNSAPELSVTRNLGPARAAVPPPLPPPPLAPMIGGESQRTGALNTNADNTLRPGGAESTARLTQMAQYFRRVADLGARAAEALEHAHQLGVIHRDVKPANLLVDRRGELWVTDFGVAMLRNNGGMTATGELVGTLRYMSPEQAGAQRGVVDHRTDVYSLGATLYELLTLHPLFESDDPGRLLQQIAAEEPRPPRALDRSIPLELELIVLKAIAKNPAERYGTAQELADDLRRYLADQPIRARRPAVVDRALKWSRRHKGTVVAAVVMLVAATVGLSVSTVLITRSAGAAKAAYERERQKADEAEKQRARAEASLTQARQVLDFLTRVCAEELGDRPELLQVRRKMLEGALQYYQQFIEQHKDDPAVRAELDANSARVAQILSALSAQQDYLHLMLRAMLLEEKAVQRDLGISSAQEEKIAELSERLTQQRREAFRDSLALTDQERGQKFKELAAANEKAVAVILDAGQVKRLKEIAVQALGPRAFVDLEVVAALDLSVSQKAEIQTVLDESRRLRDEAQSGGESAEVERQVGDIGEEAKRKILTFLNARQLATWREMTGDRFRGRLHFSPQGGIVRPPAGPPDGPPDFRPPPPPLRRPGGGPPR